MIAKNLIYLDKEKMYSISSQIFEGITEYILNEEKTVTDTTESQKGPINSGRILADVLRKENTSTEKKYLYDYAYSLFEKQLIDLGKVFSVNCEVSSSSVDQMQNFSFIKVNSKSIFNDSRQLNNFIRDFNDFGQSLTYVQNFPQINEAKEQFIKAEQSLKAKDAKNRLKQDFENSPNNSLQMAKNAGLHHDPEFLENLSRLIDFGFKDNLEIQQKNEDILYSSVLKRDFLRESEDIIIRKYSRKPEKNIVVFGMITQSSGTSTVDLNEGEDLGIKEIIMNLVEHIVTIEQSFAGRLTNEVVIDPIAVYTEL